MVDVVTEQPKVILHQPAAWENQSGYITPDGCPCWDETVRSADAAPRREHPDDLIFTLLSPWLFRAGP